MPSIDDKTHQELMKLLIKLKKIVKWMCFILRDILMHWLDEEIDSWINYLREHRDIDELKLLKEEICERYYRRYDVMIKPYFIDKIRINCFEDIISYLNRWI